MQKVRKIEAPIVSRKGESALSDEGYVIVNGATGLPIPGIGLTSDTSPKGSIIPQQTLWSSSRRKPRIARQQGPTQHASAIATFPQVNSTIFSIRSLLPARKPVAAEVVSIPSGPIPFPMVLISAAFTQLFPCKTKLDEEEEKLWWEIFGPVTDWD
ncbi:hypothetical protein BDQ17DRAFT_1361430 [Cyathus striatus]|nr:hypothetical protein BDQ17DRAFT_1361430 [Cyathus striatus]